MHQTCPSKTTAFKVDRSKNVRVGPASDLAHAEKTVETTGLCGTCSRLPTCRFSHGKQQVMFCEEFDGIVRAATAMAMTDARSLATLGQESCATGSSSEFRGLCRTCEHCEDCTFPRKESGVWNCDEFV